MIRQSYTAIVERNVVWTGDFWTEPYEAGWASEAIFFVRCLKGSGTEVNAGIQISPDGMNWCDEGSRFLLPEEGGVTFCKIRHFGNWIRLSGTLPDEITVIVTLSLKE